MGSSSRGPQRKFRGLVTAVLRKQESEMNRASGGAGILSVGTYLPDEIRTNDWWPAEVVSEWQRKAEAGFLRAVNREEMQTEGVRLCAEAIAKTIDDPFRGTKERRVMPKGMLSSDMETKAAEDAIQRAKIPRDQIDLLLTYSQI